MSNLCNITKRVVHLNVDDKKVSVGSEATEDEDALRESDWKNVLEEEPKRKAKSPSPIMSQLGNLKKKNIMNLESNHSKIPSVQLLCTTAPLNLCLIYLKLFEQMQ